ncbi:hypothetical protein BCR39DRAFT_120102 [Naematelia encephala]|uniref:Uncharacterized protein n=1 Tax=Naematelia encephala TaxID=71784 RepID=A0A1Y2BIR0_9TREE|nr:hypothetical protein BCR39DRAFT_120102 [Naematelia encephala]
MRKVIIRFIVSATSLTSGIDSATSIENFGTDSCEVLHDDRWILEKASLSTLWRGARFTSASL